MSGANGMSWFDAFVNAALMSLCLGWLFFDEGDTLVETEGETITTETWFGSHASVIVDHTEFGLELKDNEVLLKDDTHYYITTKDRLDISIADPNRYANPDATYEP